MDLRKKLQLVVSFLACAAIEVLVLINCLPMVVN